MEISKIGNKLDRQPSLRLRLKIAKFDPLTIKLHVRVLTHSNGRSAYTNAFEFGPLDFKSH